MSLIKWTQFICLSSLFVFAAGQAKTPTKKNMDPVVSKEHFDFVEYGRIEKNEIEVSLKIVQKDSDVLVALVFENISKRELHIYSMLWFQDLEILVNETSARYIGPMASMPPPQKTDFKVMLPGDRFTTESVLLNSYFALPKLPGSPCVVKYKFQGKIPAPEARFNLK